jgi:hypothetical protein
MEVQRIVQHMQDINMNKRSDEAGHCGGHWPEGALFRNPFGTGPPEGPLSLRDNRGSQFEF